MTLTLTEGTRFEALEPIRQGVREHFGGFSSQVAAGLILRHDHGTQNMSDDSLSNQPRAQQFHFPGRTPRA